MSESAARYEDTLKIILADAEEAAAYLNAALDDGDQEVFLLALRDVAEAHGMARVARSARLNRESLYKMLSPTGNPQLSSLNALLRSIGLRVAIQVEPSLEQTRAKVPVIAAESSAAYEPDPSPAVEDTRN
jgi:probable addiction module antidote protein